MPPLKSVAVTPIKRGGGRKQPSPAIHSDESEDAVSHVPAPRIPRRVAAQPTHKYRVGEHLRMTGGGHSVQRVSASCKVMALLPSEGRAMLLYRVRSDAESFERIVAEADLNRG